jgi:DNA-binding transcriptional ArsR family regulator
LRKLKPAGKFHTFSREFHAIQTPVPRLATSQLTARYRFDISRIMETKTIAAVDALSALAQEHRLALFRLLVQAGEDGMAAGAIADALGVPNSSLSFHLAHLNRAGLIRQERRGRSLVYRADYGAMNRLIAYLTENCCGGMACAPDASCAAEADAQPERKKA